MPEGDHTLRLGFIDDPFVKTLAKEEIYKDTVNKWIGSVTVIGPFASQGEKPSRKKILVCNPASGPVCVDRILATVARRAYRRPVTGAEVAALRKFVALAKDDGQSVEQGIALAIQAMLVSPHFLFHIERDLYPSDPGRVHRVSDVELASRLSYFLWNSMPDDELLSLAERRQSQPARGPRGAGDADARRSEGLRDGGEFCRPVARGAESRQHQAGSAEVPGLGSRAARRDEDRDADVLRLDPAREPSDQRIHRRAVHVPQRAAGDLLWHRRRHRTGVPARRSDDARARRRAEPWQRARRLQLSDTHVGRHSRQVHPAEHPRIAAAAAAAGCARARRAGGGDDCVAAQADGDAPDERRLRVLPLAHGSARLRARELRRDREVADHGWRFPGGFERQASGREDILERRRSAPDSQPPPVRVRPHADREAPDLRPGPRPRALRPPDHQRDHASGWKPPATASRRSCARSCEACRSSRGAPKW